MQGQRRDLESRNCFFVTVCSTTTPSGFSRIIRLEARLLFFFFPKGNKTGGYCPVGEERQHLLYPELLFSHDLQHKTSTIHIEIHD
jgi:hypothetical protein